jgi:phage-related protein
MSWKITFFNQKVEAETLAFPSGILANFLHILELIEEFGPALGKPHTAPMGSGLFEIRARGKEGIGRAL